MNYGNYFIKKQCKKNAYKSKMTYIIHICATTL